MNFNEIHFDNEVDFSPISNDTANANFLMWLTTEQYDEFAKRAGIDIDETAEYDMNVYANVSISAYEQLIDERYFSQHTSVEVTYLQDGEQQIVKSVELNADEKTALYEAMKKYAKGDDISLVDEIRANQKEMLADLGNTYGNILADNFSFDENIQIFSNNFGGVERYANVVFNDVILDELAKRVNLYELSEVADYNELLNNTDVTLETHVEIEDDKFSYIVLEAQSDTLGWGYFNVPISEEDQNTILAKFNEYAATHEIEDFSHNDFINDAEKMRDFPVLSKEEFLSSYSYLTEAEYDNTVELYQQRFLDILDKMGYKLTENENGESYSIYDVHNGEYKEDYEGNILRFASAQELCTSPLIETELKENYLNDLSTNASNENVLFKDNQTPRSFSDWMDFANRCIDGECSADEETFYEVFHTDLEDIFMLQGGYDKIDLTAVYALAEERGEWKAIAHDDVYNARFADILNDVGFQLESHENGICARDTQLNEYVTEIDEDTIAYFKSATEIVERLDTFISDSFINDLEDEFADWNMEGEMPDSNFGAWLEYAEKCKSGTEQEQEFYDSHKEEFKDMKLLAENIDKVDISKIAGNVEKGREDQKQNPNKKKSDYTDRE